MEALTEVVIDRKVLDGFKRRALKLYPREFIEQIVGRMVDHQCRIYAFRELEHEATRYEDEKRFQILGTIHTHPQSTIEPSDIDWEAMARDDELVMGSARYAGPAAAVL